MPLIFITGGVRSGKSHFAEQTAVALYQKDAAILKRLVYIASGVATDVEMEKRILLHKEDRHAQDVSWHTIESPYQITEAFSEIKENDIVLWDCVTTWLTNVFYEGFDTGQPCLEKPGYLEEKLQLMKAGVESLLAKKVTIFVVSNELFDEPAYSSHQVELYRQMLGELHQWFVSLAAEAYEMNYGIVKKWK